MFREFKDCQVEMDKLAEGQTRVMLSLWGMWKQTQASADTIKSLKKGLAAAAGQVRISFLGICSDNQNGDFVLVAKGQAKNEGLRLRPGKVEPVGNLRGASVDALSEKLSDLVRDAKTDEIFFSLQESRRVNQEQPHICSLRSYTRVPPSQTQIRVTATSNSSSSGLVQSEPTPHVVELGEGDKMKKGIAMGNLNAKSAFTFQGETIKVLGNSADSNVALYRVSFLHDSVSVNAMEKTKQNDAEDAVRYARAHAPCLAQGAPVCQCVCMSVYVCLCVCVCVCPTHTQTHRHTRTDTHTYRHAHHSAHHSNS